MYNPGSKKLLEGYKDSNKDILLVQSFQTTSSLYCEPVYWNRMYQFLQVKKRNNLNLLEKRCKVHDVKNFYLVGQVRVLIAYHRYIVM